MKSFFTQNTPNTGALALVFASFLLIYLSIRNLFVAPKRSCKNSKQSTKASIYSKDKAKQRIIQHRISIVNVLRLRRTYQQKAFYTAIFDAHLAGILSDIKSI